MQNAKPDLKAILGSNPAVDQEAFERGREAVRARRKLGESRAGYGLALPYSRPVRLGGEPETPPKAGGST
jgi:hypothetical protein